MSFFYNHVYLRVISLLFWLKIIWNFNSLQKWLVTKYISNNSCLMMLYLHVSFARLFTILSFIVIYKLICEMNFFLDTYDNYMPLLILCMHQLFKWLQQDQTHNYLVRKRTVNQLFKPAGLSKWLSGCLQTKW